MRAPNDSFRSSGTTDPTSTLKRLVAGTVYVFTTGAPLSRRYVIVTFAAVDCGFARRMTVRNPSVPPTRPSASPQRVAVETTPELLWPSPNGEASPGQYIDRSETMPTSELTTVENAAAVSFASSPAGLTVSRSRAA